MTNGVTMKPDISQIAPTAKRLKDREFVYLLTRNDEVVYVGRTKSLKNRTNRHRPEKNFDAVYYFDAPRSESRALESALVALLQPEYNGTPGRKLSAKLLFLLDSYGIDLGTAPDSPRLDGRIAQGIELLEYRDAVPVRLRRSLGVPIHAPETTARSPQKYEPLTMDGGVPDSESRCECGHSFSSHYLSNQSMPCKLCKCDRCTASQADRIRSKRKERGLQNREMPPSVARMRASL